MIKRDKTGLIGWRHEGFTLVEILIALALVTGLTLMMFQAVSPWIHLRQKIETERRLEQVHDALEMAYRLNAMRIETQSGEVMQVEIAGDTTNIVPSTISGSGANRRCNDNANAAAVIAAHIADDANRSFLDGSKQPLCLFLSPRLSTTREGVTLYYHVVAVVAMGNDGVLGQTTGLSDDGVLTIHPNSDDIGIALNGFNVQYELYQETRRRMERVADAYGAYFTARYLGNPARDYSIDYFVAGAHPYDGDADPSAGPLPTLASWQPVSTHLRILGLGPDEQVSAYESSNNIEVANQRLDPSQVIYNVQVQEPEPGNPAKLALPPYTALLRARLPGPSGTYLLRVVPGNY